MPTVLHTVQTVDEVFMRILGERGLSLDDAPAAVQLTVSVLSQAAGQYAQLVDDLPSDRRGYEWLAAAFLAYGEWCDRTVVVDTVESA